MNQFDLVASPMSTVFVSGTPPEANFAPFNHIAARVPLDQGVSTSSNVPASKLAKAWAATKARMFAGKSTKPDAEDADTVNHLNWYEATGFTKPYPGEKAIRPPTDFKNRYARIEEDDGDE
jgi:hypothetical protein